MKKSRKPTLKPGVGPADRNLLGLPFGRLARSGRPHLLSVDMFGAVMSHRGAVHEDQPHAMRVGRISLMEAASVGLLWQPKVVFAPPISLQCGLCAYKIALILFLSLLLSSLRLAWGLAVAHLVLSL